MVTFVYNLLICQGASYPFRLITPCCQKLFIKICFEAILYKIVRRICRSRICEFKTYLVNLVSKELDYLDLLNKLRYSKYYPDLDEDLIFIISVSEKSFRLIIDDDVIKDELLARVKILIVKDFPG